MRSVTIVMFTSVMVNIIYHCWHYNYEYHYHFVIIIVTFLIIIIVVLLLIIIIAPGHAGQAKAAEATDQQTGGRLDRAGRESVPSGNNREFTKGGLVNGGLAIHVLLLGYHCLTPLY